jgi:hypothetical protein
MLEPVTEIPIVECRLEAKGALFKDAGDATPAERIPWLALVLVRADGAARRHDLSLEEARTLAGALGAQRAAPTAGARATPPPRSSAALLREGAGDAASEPAPFTVRDGEGGDPRTRTALPADGEVELYALAPEHVEDLVRALEAALVRWSEAPPSMVVNERVGEVAAVGPDGAPRSVRVEVEAIPVTAGAPRRVVLWYAHEGGASDTWLFTSDEVAALEELVDRARGAGERPRSVGAIGGAEPWLSVSADGAGSIALTFDDEMVRERWSDGFTLRLEVADARRLRDLVQHAQELAGSAPSGGPVPDEPELIARLSWSKSAPRSTG